MIAKLKSAFVNLASTEKVPAMCAAGAVVWNSGATICYAHPGHSVEIVSSQSPLHYFVQLEHALPLVACGVAIWCVRRMVQKQLARRVVAKKVV